MAEKEFEAKELEGIGPLDKWQLSKTVLSSILKAAEEQNLTINLRNIKGKPFRIVTGAGGRLDWGVGGG